MFIVRDITKAYHGRPVLEAVSFALPAGHCLGVTGENGAGKSTLLRILAQGDVPDRGDILFGGRSVLGDKQFLRKSLGYVPQNCDLLPDLTAGQQLRLWQAACGVTGSLPGEVAELLDFPELEKVKIAEMSGGMQRRVSIALALSTSPRILVMDEATAGLDSRFREGLLTWLEDYLRNGGRIIWCSHLAEENARLCGTVLPLGQR